MKLFVKILVLLLILAMAGPFFMRGPDGQPLMRLGDVTQRLKAWMNKAPSVKPGDKVELHKWQDENGQWHYSDAAPSQGSEIITVDPNVNVIQATKVPPPKTETKVDAPKAEAPEEKKLPPIFNPVDETNKVKEELEQRNQEMLERLDDI